MEIGKIKYTITFDTHPQPSKRIKIENVSQSIPVMPTVINFISRRNDMPGTSNIQMVNVPTLKRAIVDSSQNTPIDLRTFNNVGMTTSTPNISNLTTNTSNTSIVATPQPSTSQTATPQPSTSQTTTPQPSTSQTTTPQPSTSRTATRATAQTEAVPEPPFELEYTEEGKIKLPSIYTIRPNEMYAESRLKALIRTEKMNQQKFIKANLFEYPLKNTYNREKVRRVCRQIQIDPKDVENGDIREELERKAMLRSINNQKSLISRYKQKISRVSDGLSILYLRKRITSYEERIAKVLEMILSTDGVKTEETTEEQK